MKNIDLNAGGLIGALACGGVTAAVVIAVSDPHEAGRTLSKLIIFALIGGAFAGNYLWSLVFKKPEQATSGDAPAESIPGRNASEQGQQRG